MRMIGASIGKVAATDGHVQNKVELAGKWTDYNAIYQQPSEPRAKLIDSMEIKKRAEFPVKLDENDVWITKTVKCY